MKSVAEEIRGLLDLLNEGSRPSYETVIDFPTDQRKKQVRKDRGLRIDDVTGLEVPDVPYEPEYHITDPDVRVSYGGIYSTAKEAHKDLPSIKLRTGRRDLVVTRI